MAMLVKDLMTQHVITILPSDSLRTAWDRMDEEGIRHLPVVDRADNLVGIISQRDLAGVSIFSSRSLDTTETQDLLQDRQVREVMHTDVSTADADTDAAEAGLAMLENKMGCLPVTEGTHLVGILTEADFVRHVVQNESKTKTRRVAI